MWKKIIRVFAIMLLSCSFLLLSTTRAQEGQEKPGYERLLDKLESLEPGERIEVRLGTEKELYEIDDPFEVRFQASEDCYVMLMDISSAQKDSPGDIQFLLPNYKFLDNKIEAGRVYSTLHDFGLKIKVAPPYGVEVINIFCSAEKIDLFETDFEKEPYYTVKHDDDERLEALLNRFERLEQVEWSGNSVKVKIGNPRAIPRKFGALPPIGSTGTTGKFFPPIGSTGTTGKK